jgi:hypothetical protein
MRAAEKVELTLNKQSLAELLFINPTNAKLCK